VDHRLLAISSQAKKAAGEIQGMIINTLQAGLAAAQSDFAAKLLEAQASCYPVAAAHTRICLSKKQIEKLIRKIQEWSKQCQAAHDDDGEVEYSLTLAFHPIKEKKSK
jgi:hypothetical protein